MDRECVESTQHDIAFPASLGHLSECVRAVSSALTFIANPDVLVSNLGDVVAIRNQFDALMTQFSSQLVASGGPGSVGLRTVGQLVGAYTNADPAPFRANDLLGRWLRDFPLFAQAHEDGDMSASHLSLLRRTADSFDTHFALRGDQQIFVDLARDGSFADFKSGVEYWLIRIDPDGDEPEEQIRKTSLSVRIGRGGRVKLDGDFDALTGQALRSAIDRVSQQMALADTKAGVMRSESNRRAAALVELVTKGAARKDGTYAAPLINIVMSATVAEWALEQANGPTSDPPPVAWNDIDGRCELIDGTPIHPLLAVSTFGAATFRRYIMTADSRLLDVSVAARAFPEWMRTALQVQARGRCETHGCDAPFRWLQADHSDPWSTSRRTALRDGQVQCAADNQAKGAQTGLLPWNERPHPHRQTPRFAGRGSRSSSSGDPDDPDSDYEDLGRLAS